MTTVATAVSAHELAELDGRYELVDGKPQEMQPTGYPHGKATANAAFSVVAHVRPRGLGDVLGAETGFRIQRDPDTVLAPDLAFVSAARLPADPGAQAFLDLVPDLVVEVISPSDRAGEVGEKVGRWLAAGVRLVWVVYPQQRFVAVHTSTGVTHEHGAVTGGEVLPDLRIELAELFA